MDLVFGLIAMSGGIYFLLMSLEKLTSVQNMAEEELEEWRAKKKRPLQIVSILLIIGGALQALGIIKFFTI